MKDVKDTEIQAGMYIIYAAEYYDSLEQRIAFVIAVKTITPQKGKAYTFLSIRSARRNHAGTWETVKSTGLKHGRGIFAVSNTHIPEEVVTLLERKGSKI